MSEDEETVCRLTYKEGNEIEKEARGPYKKISLDLLILGIVAFLGCAAAMWVVQEFDIGDHETLDMLLASGESSQGWYDYVIEYMNSQTLMVGYVMMLVCLCSAAMMSGIGSIEGRKALKKANEEKEEALKMVREEGK